MRDGRYIMKNLQINMVFKNIKDNIDFRLVQMSSDYSDIVCIGELCY